MAGTLSRSWELLKETMHVLQMDKELLLFPVISGIVVILIVASFILPLLFAGFISESLGPILLVIFVFLLYFIAFFVVIFFNSALIACAYKRLQGGDPTIGYGIRTAAGHLGQIIAWSLLSATVGLILSAIRDRGGFVGAIVAGLLGAAWSLVTFFVIPVMIFEEKGTIASIGESWQLFKKTWGENVVGSIGLWLVFVPVLVVLLLTIVAAFYAVALLIPMLVLFIFVLVICAILYSTLRGIFVAALYFYAKTGNIPGVFQQDFIRNAFVPKIQQGNI